MFPYIYLETINSLLRGMEIVDLKKSKSDWLKRKDSSPDWLKDESKLKRKKIDSDNIIMRELSTDVDVEFGGNEKKTGKKLL